MSITPYNILTEETKQEFKNLFKSDGRMFNKYIYHYFEFHHFNYENEHYKKYIFYFYIVNCSNKEKLYNKLIKIVNQSKILYETRIKMENEKSKINGEYSLEELINKFRNTINVHIFKKYLKFSINCNRKIYYSNKIFPKKEYYPLDLFTSYIKEVLDDLISYYQNITNNLNGIKTYFNESIKILDEF